MEQSSNAKLIRFNDTFHELFDSCKSYLQKLYIDFYKQLKIPRFKLGRVPTLIQENISGSCVALSYMIWIIQCFLYLI